MFMGRGIETLGNGCPFLGQNRFAVLLEEVAQYHGHKSPSPKDKAKKTIERAQEVAPQILRRAQSQPEIGKAKGREILLSPLNEGASSSSSSSPNLTRRIQLISPELFEGREISSRSEGSSYQHENQTTEISPRSAGSSHQHENQITETTPKSELPLHDYEDKATAMSPKEDREAAVEVEDKATGMTPRGNLLGEVELRPAGLKKRVSFDGQPPTRIAFNQEDQIAVPETVLEQTLAQQYEDQIELPETALERSPKKTLAKHCHRLARRAHDVAWKAFHVAAYSVFMSQGMSLYRASVPTAADTYLSYLENLYWISAKCSLCFHVGAMFSVAHFRRRCFSELKLIEG